MSGIVSSCVGGIRKMYKKRGDESLGSVWKATQATLLQTDQQHPTALIFTDHSSFVDQI